MVLFRPLRSLRMALHYWRPRQLTIGYDPRIWAWFWWNFEWRSIKGWRGCYVCGKTATTPSQYWPNAVICKKCLPNDEKAADDYAWHCITGD
jgi:hypothetical protein